MGGIVKLTDPRTGKTLDIEANEVRAINVDPIDVTFRQKSIGKITQLLMSDGAVVLAQESPDHIVEAVTKLRDPGIRPPYLFHGNDMITQRMAAHGPHGAEEDDLPPDPDTAEGLSAGIQNGLQEKLSKQQQIYMLHQQIDVINEKLKELGEDNGEDDNERLARMVKEADMPEEAKKDAQNELMRLKKMSPMSPEAGVARTWLELLVQLPWGKYPEVNKDINKAEDQLNADHYGMDKVKDRVLDFIAVMNQPDATGQGKILCLVGPPGVGKTSIAESIAKATGRVYQRIALGGVKEEAEIRGHRRTFIGALPGNVVTALKRAGTNNPLILFDEIDKMGSDNRGDPASAMLEVLDPAQNKSFRDHYLGETTDLSKCMFVCTANEEDKIPAPLWDRMEIIRLPGYTREQKVEIANRHLVDRKMKEVGLKKEEFTLEQDALRSIINDYTREAGVRNLDRLIGTVASKAVRQIQKTHVDKVVVTQPMLADMLGAPHVSGDHIPDQDTVGIVNGLAWSAVGGSTLQIEAIARPGKDFKMTVTGNLKEVMKESAEVAHSVALTLCDKFNIASKAAESEVHVHALSGSIPKDGPSAGAAMTTVIFSAVSGIKIKRDVAMTGEISLHGKVMKIGGLPEKLDGALRDGCTTVLIPKDNVNDLSEVPNEIKSKLKIIPVSTIDEVLDLALVSPPSTAITMGRVAANTDGQRQPSLLGTAAPA